MRRNLSRSRARDGSDNDDLELALQRLVDKLRACEPFYTEEDVAVIPFPGEATSSSPSRSPSRSGEGEQSPRGDLPSVAEKRKDGEEGKRPQTQPGRPQAQPVSGGPSTGSTIDLDQPLSASLFLTAVNVLEPKSIGKSRRGSLEAVKLIKQGYALTWHDPQFITESAKSALSSTELLSTRSFMCPRAVSPGSLPEDRPSAGGGKWPPAGHPPSASTKSRSPAPAFTPDAAHVLLLDQAVQSLLVYANSSFFLSQHISSQESVLRLFCFVCWAARRAEDAAIAVGVEEAEKAGDGEEGLHSSFKVGGVRPPTGGEGRDLDRELAALESTWAACGLAGRIVEFLRECYLTEFLLDACLPPAVCSSRYDGISGALLDKKQRILLDMVTSRHGFSTMMKGVSLRGLAGIAAMSNFAEPKLKARLLDKMASEGLVDRLHNEINSACVAISEASAAPVTPSASLPAATWKGGSRAGASPSRASLAKRPRASQDSRHVSQSSSQKTSLQSTPVPPPDPPAAEAKGSQSPAAGAGEDPVERLGYCVDLLLLLTSPNLRPASEADELARNPKTAPSAVVRATVWATHEKALHGITLQLLWMVCRTSGRRGHPRLSSLQATATECVLQLAAYSGVLYGMVIAAVESLFKGKMRRAAGGRGNDVSFFSRSPARSPAPKPTIATSLAMSSIPSDAVADAAMDDPSGVLPLIVHLLRHTTHAAANAGSIRRWFRWLADNLLPQAFEAPQLTNGRKSSAAWGRRRREEQRQYRQGQEQEESACKASSVERSSSKAQKGGSSAQRPEAPILARDLTRAEITSLSPFFSFAVRLVTETPWRDGAEPFLAKAALLAYHVVLLNARRCNLCFGQASTCFDVVAPLLLPVGGVIPGDAMGPSSTPASASQGDGQGSGRRGRRGSGPEPDDTDAALDAPSSGKKRDRSDGDSEDEGDGDFQLFIPSPSRSPVFYEAYSPAASEVTFIGERSPLSAEATPPGSPTRQLDMTGTHSGTEVGNGVASDADHSRSCSNDGGSPQGTLTRSWRHSLKMLVNSIGGSEEAELRQE